MGTPPTMIHSYERTVLAEAFRVFAARGLSASSGLGNHLTMSVPPHYDTFLVNRYGLHWIEVTAENLLLVNASGAVLQGEGVVQGAAVALHGPVHRALGRTARVVFHTHQPWASALCCVEPIGLRVEEHADARLLRGRVGVDPEYTGNWPVGSRGGGVLAEGDRLLRVPTLRGKEIGFLANHGVLIVSDHIDRALAHTVWLEALARDQVLRDRDGRTDGACHHHYQAPDAHVDVEERLTRATARGLVARYGARIPRTWNGSGPIPLTREQCAAWRPARVPGDEWHLRCTMAAACRLIARLNGYETREGLFPHLSARLDETTTLVIPADVPLFAMTASAILRCRAAALDRCDDRAVSSSLLAFDALRTLEHPVVAAVRTRHADGLVGPLRFLHQSAFNFADDAYVDARNATWYMEAPELRAHMAGRVFGRFREGCVVRARDVAHAHALLHSFDAAAQIQTIAEMTGLPLRELHRDDVRTFPRHGYGALDASSKRAELNLAANMRMLAADWNQGERDTGDSEFTT